MNNEKQTTFYLSNDIGLGSSLIMLSYLIDRNKTIPSRLVLHENKLTASMFKDFIKIFKITPELLPIDFLSFDNQSFPRHDILHFFSGYHFFDEICLFDKTFTNQAKRGKVVGLCCYPHLLGSQNYKRHYDKSNFIFNRSMSMDYNKLLFEKLLDCGYDVITLDQPISIEEKSYLISQMCDFVIGYEGGMMHLAHMLKTPTIILPRKIDNDLTNQMLHPCDSAWLLEDENIFLEWSKEEIEQIINLCNTGQGNNKFFTGQYKFCIDQSLDTWAVYDSKKFKNILHRGKHSAMFYPEYYDVTNFFVESGRKIGNSRPIYFFSEIESRPVLLTSDCLAGFDTSILTHDEDAYNLTIVFNLNQSNLGEKNKIVDIFKKNLTSSLIIRKDWSQLLNINHQFNLISNFLNNYNLRNDCYRIGFLGQDSIEVNLLDKMLKKHGFAIHKGVYGEYILVNTPIYDLSNFDPVKKFSCFNRSHKKERLDFFSELIEKDLLQNFIYTYNNHWPYDSEINKKYQDKEFLKSQVDMIFSSSREKINNWIEGIPYTLSGHDNLVSLRQKFLFQNLSKSFFHIVLETDQQTLDIEYIDGELIRHAMVTEKTYKAISCRRPFLIYSGPFALEYLKLRGYKTFHPYILEDYDKIEDMVERRRAIIEEITRLNSMSDQDFLQVYNNCKDICEHNYRLFLEQSNINIDPWFQKLGVSTKYPHYFIDLTVEEQAYALSMLAH